MLEDSLSKILFKDSIGVEIANSLKDKILDKESYILSLKTNRPYRGTVSTSITTKHREYNLLDFGWEECDLIAERIKNILSPIDPTKKIYVKMWANIYRKGEYILKHTHYLRRDLFHDPSLINQLFAGHCFLYSTQTTNTTFYFGTNEIKTDLENIPGQIDIFSAFVPHEFKTWFGELRVGIAFDIEFRDVEYVKNNIESLNTDHRLIN